jgi:hypothetical protein
MITLWRLGYQKHRGIRGAGWRPWFWRFYWFDPVEERAWLERWARVLNVEPIIGERSKALRRRLVGRISGIR